MREVHGDCQWWDGVGVFNVCVTEWRDDLRFCFCFEDMKGYTDGPDLLFRFGMELTTMQHPHTDMPRLRNIVLELPCWAFHGAEACLEKKFCPIFSPL